MLTGDVNLMNVTDPEVPFARVKDTLGRADVLFGNLECCFYEPPHLHSLEHEGFHAPLAAARALVIAGYQAVGTANNVNYGAEAIRSSLGRLESLGIAATGAGVDRRSARAPAIVTHEGLRFGFTQRTSVYWATGHEATDTSPGVAVLTGRTAYEPALQARRPGLPPANRPGLPPAVITWADARSLAEFTSDLRALRTQADVVVASHHWGLFEEVLDYQVEIAHAAIDAGADAVMGHGPHYACAIEMYRGKPIFYGLGSFSFHTGHGGRQHGDWLGMMVRAEVARDGASGTRFQFARHNDKNETVLCTLSNERAAFEDLARRSAQRGAKLTARGDEVLVEPA